MKSALEKLLIGIKKGRNVNASSLRLGKEEFVSLVSSAVENGYIEGVYISFCDSQSVDNLLSSAVLTEKGRLFLEG